MSKPNIGWLFYKDYYNNLTNNDYIFMLLSKEKREKREEQTELEEKINNSVQKVINQEIKNNKNRTIGNTHFKATTTYPGLILGSGNAHELPDIKGQAILGFHFDYTTGLPTITGSSIKGVLRSAFKYTEYIIELLDDKQINVKELEKEIFENGDIFFDANIISSGKILDDDYITPHKDILKNPIPLRFIKVAPNVEFLFDFELKNRILNRDKKAKLFIKILSDLGIGAKTNVGYGRFTNIKIYETEEEILSKEQEKKQMLINKLANMSPVDRVFQLYENNPTKVILAMQKGEIEDYEAIKVKLAQKVKKELQKTPKGWKKAKQKALTRKIFINNILNNL